MIHTSRQLKDLVRNKSNGDSKKAQVYIRIYCMERFLERLTLSEYRDNFILKGGMLVSSMIGIDRRATMDIDTTIQGKNLSVDDARVIISEIIAVPLDDGITFELKDVYEIMEEAEYSGVRIMLSAQLDSMRTPVKIDISTGDAITPKEIRYSYKLMFEDREIELLSYNLPTILAEKTETVISRGTANTRLRDFYDIYTLCEQYLDRIDWSVVSDALDATSKKRGSEAVLKDAALITGELRDDSGMRSQWMNYQKKNDYAQDITWDDAIDVLFELLRKIDLTDEGDH